MAGFQSALEEYEAEGITIVAGSSDSRDKTDAYVKKLNLTYPVACEMDVASTCTKTGGFYEKNGGYIEPAGFLIRPDRTIEIAVYSTGPIGRLEPQDVLTLVQFYKSRTS